MLGVASLGHLHLGFSFPVFGVVIFGTPDDVYTFESGATYEGMTNAFGEYRRLIPDNNSPRIFSFGKGPRGDVV